MKTTLEKITPEPQPVKKLPFPKLVIYRDHGIIVLMTEERCGILLKADELRNDMFKKSTGWADDKDWEDLAPDEYVKLMN